MRLARFLPVLCATLSAGCLTSSAVIHVKPDGSGAITNTVLLKAATMELLNSLQSARSESGGEKPQELFSEEKMRAMAPRMGDGVTFESVQPMKQTGWEGAKVTYAFKDITRVRFDLRSDMTAEAAAAAGKKPEVLIFRFTPATPAAPARLTVVMPEPDLKKLEAAAKEEVPLGGKMDDSALGKAMMEQFKPMFDGMRASVAVEVDGHIIRTNADHVTGSTVTLLALDFGELMKNDGDFGTFAGLTDGTVTLAAAREKLKNVKGLVLTLQPEVTVEFRGR